MTATQAPTPGPLSAEDVKLLVKGDLLGSLYGIGRLNDIGEYLSVERLADGDLMPDAPEHFTFIGRPDADGWMPWSGGENPVPGRTVEVRFKGEAISDGFGASGSFHWQHSPHPGHAMNIIAFRLAPTAPVEASGSEECSDLYRLDDPFNGSVTRLASWPEGLVLWHDGEIVWRSWGPKALRPQPSGETR